MKRMHVAAVAAVLAVVVMVSAGWDQVKRSIYELSVDKITVETAITVPAGTFVVPNAVVLTNTIVGVGNVTNEVVVTGGQITAWTVTQ